MRKQKMCVDNSKLFPWLMLFSFPMGALTGFIMHMINKSPLRASLLKEEGEKA